jgi:nitroreductase
MNLEDALHNRKTVRSYAERQVPLETVKELISLAVQAPSACDRRGWRFILVKDKKLLRQLSDRGGASFIKKAPQALIVCYLSYSDNKEWADREQSAASAAAYFQLAAHERGIGSCWVCHLPPRREVRRMFGIPRDFRPVCCITFGYYAEKDRAGSTRGSDRAADAFVCLNRWEFTNSAPDSLRRLKRSLLFRCILKKAYYLLPFRKYLRGIAERFERTFD